MKNLAALVLASLTGAFIYAQTAIPTFPKLKESDPMPVGLFVNLAKAVSIVVVVLLFTMGRKTGIIIGLVLFLTIMATFLVMYVKGDLLMERISLGALIIALCMLTDNAIIVIEGIKVGIEAGKNKLDVVREVVAQNQWPLFGATAIGVIAFAAIGLSEDRTGEYTNSLFWVILIALSLSWVSSVTVTPLLSYYFFKPAGGASAGSDPYGSLPFRAYRGLLALALRYRWLVIAGSAVATVIANYVALISLIIYIYARDLPLRLRGAELRYLIPTPALLKTIVTKGFPAGFRRVRQHRALGHRTVLITGALDIVVEQNLRPLFDEIICARMAPAADGTWTGELTHAPPTGEARAMLMQEYAEAEGLRLEEAVAYADSASDLPMLEAVGFPVAVNPETRLSAIARKRGWLVEHWAKAPGHAKPLLLAKRQDPVPVRIFVQPV